MKHLQHSYETFETLENILLQHALSAQRNISLLLGRMEAHRLWSSPEATAQRRL
jgi:hypothetical protein